ncbi:MAG: PLDc N-terminal domain-containing protein [Phycisphaerae bacterium]|nr:PLDc N-terminal domain-containing protein [Phycisphaerae bacterium]
MSIGFWELLIVIPVGIIALIALIFWIWMLIDCLTRDYREFGTLITSNKSADRLVWFLIILFTFIIGAIAYHISIRRRPRSAEQSG